MSKSGKQDSGYYALITGFSSGIHVTVVGCETEEINRSLSFQTSDFPKFVRDFSKIFNPIYKAIVLNVFQCFNNQNPDNIEFCAKLREQLDKLKIPYYFISNEMLLPTTFLLATNFTCQPGEEVMIPMIDQTGICSYAYRREVDGYLNIRQRRIFMEETKDLETFKPAFYGDISNPKRIIAFGVEPNLPLMKFVRKNIKSNKLIVLEGRHRDSDIKFLIETSKWILDNSKNQFYVKPMSTRRFYASPKNDKNVKDAMIVVNYNEALPLTRKYAFARTVTQLYLTHSKGEPNPNLHFYKACTPKVGGGDCHRRELVISVDNHNSPTAEMKKVFLPQIQSLLSTLDEIMEKTTTKIPIIGFFDNSSVICIFDEEIGKYKFLDSWNGVYGKDLYLNLKPAKPVLEFKPPMDAKSVITFKAICSLKSSLKDEATIINAFKNIKLTKDNENEFLLGFDQMDGIQKHASPKFLLALIIREHYLEIKKQTGLKIKKFGIHYFGDVEDENEKARFGDPKDVGSDEFPWFLLNSLNGIQTKTNVQTLLKESCDLMGIEYFGQLNHALILGEYK